MIRDEIRKDIYSAINSLHLEVGIKAIDEIEVTRTSDPKFGDFTTNISLRVTQSHGAKEPETDKAQSKQSPMEFAKILAQSLQKQPYLKKLEVKEPGFLNFFIKDEIWQKEVENVLKKNKDYGSNSLGKGKKARVEFVSANPTGPLHFGNARGGPPGGSFSLLFSFFCFLILQ